MADPQVLLKGVDLWAQGWVTSINNLSSFRTFQKNIFVVNEFVLPVDNSDDNFSIDNTKSFLNGTKWHYSTVQIIDRLGDTIWNGVLVKVRRNHNAPKTAMLVMKDSIFKLRNKIISYQSAGWETPAAAFEAICIQEGYEDIDDIALTASKNVYENAGCYIKCNFQQEDEITFQQAIDKIADYGNADLYNWKNLAVFEAWAPVTTSGHNGFSDTTDDFINLPVVDTDEESIINEFSISYFQDQGVPATDADNNNVGSFSRDKFGTKSLPELDTAEGQIIFKDLTTALFIGEGRIKRTHQSVSSTNVRPLDRIDFTIDIDDSDLVDLKTVFQIDLADEEWTDKVFRTYEYTKNEDDNTVDITAYTIPS